jgi:hypothetical protein
MKGKGRRWKRARRHSVVRCWLEPLAWAVGIAAIMGAFLFLLELTGFQGRERGFPHRHSVARAWRDVPLITGAIFVIAFVVLVVHARIRRSRQPGTRDQC